MNLLCKSISLTLNPPSSHQLPPSSFNFTTTTTTTFRRCRCSFMSSDHPASMSEIDMVPTKQGFFIAKPKKVVILWDLDNKPPRGPPYDAAMALKNIANHFGQVVEASAYANRHAFIHLPHWVLEQRRDQRRVEILERKGVATPSEPYICGVCGRKCKTNLDLKKHFKQLHVREREKKMNRMKSLKGKKRQRFKERFISGNHKYAEAARTLVTPKVGYGLAAELRRAGIFVKTVEDKPQAADWALKRQMQHSMSRGIDWLVLVSDDSDFSEMLRKARASNLGTVVVGDWDRALGRQADLWVPWNRVENGEITEEDLVPRSTSGEFVNDLNAGVCVSNLDELLGEKSDFYQSKISVFSEGEDEDEVEDEDEDEEDVMDASDYLSDSDDEEEDDEALDWYT
ncbi:uncharacterized protein LOC112501628 [Cynara cardunculus var. scolymus]|uniref:C2H2-type domain-containing protein n=1 Tax=Cynara cardunculus var. scolymus TaxID=59895 RepID=A0A118JSK9_CYNCS|nr:uncharacterized protein LOC112501628 [Cynara cardunculus var. scolymus]KVH88826.1 hypothetical protein Ccrd_025348 [Cynara cardunculus var. scolymus]